MFETARYDGARRVRGTLVLAAGIGVLSVFFVWYFTQIGDLDVDAMFESMDPLLLQAFGIETLATIEGFLAAEVYTFVWLLGLGLYFAYSAGGLVASDVEHDRLDLLLSLPVSRSRLLAEKFASLLVPIVVVNVVVGLVVYGSVLAIGESIDPVVLAMTHLLSVPYLLACAAVGTILSVLVDRADVARRLALALVFVLYLVESVLSNAAGLEWIGYVNPSRYYEPTAILVHGTYDLLDATILLAAVLVLLVGAQLLFERRDV